MALILSCSTKGFPVSSAGKESSCNAGDPDFIPGSGRSSGEGIGYPLQYSWISLVAQMVKNLPTVQQTWVWSLGWKDPLEKGTATHSNILARRIPWAEETGRLHTVHGITKNWTWLSDFHSPWSQSGFVWCWCFLKLFSIGQHILVDNTSLAPPIQELLFSLSLCFISLRICSLLEASKQLCETIHNWLALSIAY